MVQRHWYAVHTQPARERTAVEHLRRQGFEIFFPHQIKTVRHARRAESRAASYFPGYLFAALDLTADRWRAINGTVGVRGLVMSGERPARAPAGLIETLRQSCGQDGLVRRPPLNAGDQVRVLSGPFADALGVIDRLEGAQRVRVLIELIGGAWPISLAGGDLALAS